MKSSFHAVFLIWLKFYIFSFTKKISIHEQMKIFWSFWQDLLFLSFQTNFTLFVLQRIY